MTIVFIGAPVNDELAERTQTMIERLRANAAAVKRGEVVDLVGDLTKASFDYHFIRSLDDLGVGFATKKTIQVSLGTAVKVIRSTMQKVVGGLTDDNFAKIADLLEAAYLTVEDGEELGLADDLDEVDDLDEDDLDEDEATGESLDEASGAGAQAKSL